MDLQTIFGYLVDDPNFLTAIYDCTSELSEYSAVKKDKIMLNDLVVEYVPLIPFDIQKYNSFPLDFREILPINYVRCGIKTTILRNMVNVNISFLNSLNVLLRPEIFKMSINDQLKNYDIFESFITHKIKGNCRIDKIKNTKKVQSVNKAIVQNLVSGKITFDVIQSVINILEVNLAIFDMINNEISFYWAYGYN